jgi:hypothetical protein
MGYPWSELALGGSVALEFVSNDHARHVRQALEQLAEELLRGPLVAAALPQDIENVAFLIDGPPQIVMLPLDRQKYLIKVPLVPRPRPAATELIGVLLATRAAPLTDRLIRHDHSTFQQQLFHITKAEAEAKVQPHGVAE